MFSGIVSDHWSQATFHIVSDTVEDVIRKLQVYLDDEISLHGVEAFIWDENGEVVANLYKDVTSDANAWVWRSMDNEIIASIFDDHRGRRLSFFHEDSDEVDDDAPQEMEWDDDIDVYAMANNDDEDPDPTMVAVLITDSEDLFMIGSGTPESLAREISSRLNRQTDSPNGGVWRLSGGQRLMKVHMGYNAWHMKWENLSSGESFMFKFEDCIGTMDKGS